MTILPGQAFCHLNSQLVPLRPQMEILETSDEPSTHIAASRV